jgi:hypothetical protein
VSYAIGAKGCGVSKSALNGRPLAFEREHNPYRDGAAHVPIKAVMDALQAKKNTLEIALQ